MKVQVSKAGDMEEDGEEEEGKGEEDGEGEGEEKHFPTIRPGYQINEYHIKYQKMSTI